MNISCFPTGIVNLQHPGQGMLDISHAGFTDIVLDMNLACSGGDFEEFGKEDKKSGSRFSGRRVNLANPLELQQCFNSFLLKAQEIPLYISAAYAPCLLRNTKRTDLQEMYVNMIEECIRLCGRINCRYLVVRPLFARVMSGDEWKVNREYYLHLAAIAKEQDVMILIENQCRDIGGHLVRGICSDGNTASEWIDLLNGECAEERFGFCLDVGACNLCGLDMHEFVTILGKRLKMVILRDSDGESESAMLPFSCAYRGQSQTDWLGLIRALRKIDYSGNLAVNIADTAAAFSPLLRPQLLTLTKSVAEYFRWQIELESALKKYRSIVLFGAGNMCRNYMKCYGEQYPPLFTCDNNMAVWGTSFCGLEVKSPEALKELPPDCGIFICNIYYREIEKQLHEMGIDNIEFFNDEYMPSFYFDRL